MTRLFTAILAALLATLALPAGAAETIRVCSDDQPHPPFYFPDREGTVQVLLRMAAARAGVEIQIVPMPVRRCEAEIQNGGADAIAVAEFESQALKRYVFPLRNGRADPAKSVASTSALVFRSKGSSASWDGRRFTNLNGPVLVQTGHVFITRRLESMHIPFDSGAAAAEQNFLKLIGKRGDLAVLPENDGLALLREPKWAAKIEALPAPFTTEKFFLVFSKRYFQAKAPVAEALWQASADLNTSRESR
jgi:polar amino acid transport system substrate-binding protein